MQVFSLIFSAGTVFIEPAFADARAHKTYSPARDEMKCLIEQSDSAYLAAKDRLSTRSRIYVRVLNRRQSGLSVRADKAFGSSLYALINGRRFFAKAGEYVLLDSKAIADLRKDPVIYVSWTKPGGGNVDHADVLAGFAAAYDDCVAYMEGPKPPAPK